ncbi:class I SAM-dependent methyltransferase [bacterium]|nr:class I SAM-dependent methyltransferase [bacterium]
MTLAEAKNKEYKICRPYEAIAPIYDKLMSHVEYRSWSDFIANILMQEPSWPPEMLELACGTGIMAGYFAERGVHVTGIDRCRAMIERACEKNYKNNPQFLVADFCSISLKKRFDAVVCLYDSINYVMIYNDLITFMKGVNRVLKDNGIFIFDICTRYNSRTNFIGFEDSGSVGDFFYHRLSNYSVFTHIHINDFSMYKISGRKLLFKEHHEQYIYTAKQIKSAVHHAGLKLEAEFDDICFRKAHSHSLRIHFLCRKN